MTIISFIAINFGAIYRTTKSSYRDSPSTEEGMISSTLHVYAAHHGSDTGAGADRGRSSQCLCWVDTARI